MKIIKEYFRNRSHNEILNPLRIRAPKDTREKNPLTTATILDYLQVTHVKDNISKQNGWDFTNNNVKHIIHQLQLTT